MLKNSRPCVICGTMFFTPPSSNRHSCNAECSKKVHSQRTSRHGESRTRLYIIWHDMKHRVKSARLAKYYGGLTVCDEWQSYEAFRDWAMSSGYRDDLEIDRRDNLLGYSPSNCRWATRAQQTQNRLKVRSKTSSRYRGVSFHKKNKNWRAQGCVNRKWFHIGCYDTEIEAAMAYDSWALANFGEFASINFKEDFANGVSN